MESSFLQNLKNAVDTGEFNSEAAKNINKILDKSDEVNLEVVKEKINNIELKPVSEEEALKANTEYELKMAEFKKEDAINKQLAMLIDIEDMIRLSIADMFDHIDVLTESYIENKTEIPDVIMSKIEDIQSKYESIIKK